MCARFDGLNCNHNRRERHGFSLRSEPTLDEGLDERIERVRISMIDAIGIVLSREFAQDNPFEPFDRMYVVKTITRVLDDARDRAALAAGDEP
jgi:hypothetical protein